MDIPYSSAVSRLLTLGEAPVRARQWPEYAVELGLGSEDVPELIRMAIDPTLNWADGESAEVWAPIHAWRTLGQLRAASAAEPLTALMDELSDSDWILEELPTVFGLIGGPALPILAAYLIDPSHDLYSRVAAANGLKEIAERDPSTRSDAVNALAEPLRRSAQNDAALNGFLISYLVDLRAVGAAALMEHAFGADQVDLSIMGDWEDVQVALGLLDARVTPPPAFQLFPDSMPPNPVVLASGSAQQAAKAKAKLKSRRAMAKAARRRNRGKGKKKR